MGCRRAGRAGPRRPAARLAAPRSPRERRFHREECVARETGRPPGSRRPAAKRGVSTAANRARKITWTWPMRLMLKTPSRRPSDVRPRPPGRGEARWPSAHQHSVRHTELDDNLRIIIADMAAIGADDTLAVVAFRDATYELRHVCRVALLPSRINPLLRPQRVATPNGVLHRQIEQRSSRQDAIGCHAPLTGVRLSRGRRHGSCRLGRLLGDSTHGVHWPRAGPHLCRTGGKR